MFQSNPVIIGNYHIHFTALELHSRCLFRVSLFGATTRPLCSSARERVLPDPEGKKTHAASSDSQLSMSVTGARELLDLNTYPIQGRLVGFR